MVAAPPDELSMGSYLLGRLGVLVDLALGELRQGLVRLLFLGEGRL